MRVKDEELFTNQKLVRTGRVISEVLQACWVETLDKGPYGQDPPIWSQVACADRTYALIQVRIASYGHDYEFRVNCNNSLCKHNFAWGIDLREIETLPISEIGKQHLSTGQPFEIKLPDDSVVKCRVLRGEDEEAITALGDEDEGRILTTSMTRRIVELQGETIFDDIMNKVSELPARFGDVIMDETDEVEGGVDTTFDVQCPKCKGVQSVMLPFEAAFFSSRKRFAGSRRKRTGSTG